MAKKGLISHPHNLHTALHSIPTRLWLPFVWPVKILLLLLFAPPAFAQVVRDMAPPPPGTVAASKENLYIDSYEVDVAQWDAFTSHVRQTQGAEAAQQYQPDTVLLRNWKGYLSDKKYRSHPIVSVTYEQVLGFCAWRSQMVSAQLKQANAAARSVVYRLPTPEEWQAIARYALEGKDFMMQVPTLAIQGNIPLLATNKKSICLRGVCYLFGNVAEMTSEKGVAKGGSWNHGPSLAGPTSQQTYNRPATWLGFRCVAQFVNGQ